MSKFWEDIVSESEHQQNLGTFMIKEFDIDINEHIIDQVKKTFNWDLEGCTHAAREALKNIATKELCKIKAKLHEQYKYTLDQLKNTFNWDLEGCTDAEREALKNIANKELCEMRDKLYKLLAEKKNRLGNKILLSEGKKCDNTE